VIVVGRRSRPESAVSIVRKALASIKSNYPDNPFLMEAYYRDYMQFDETYLNMFEALVQIEDNGISTNDYESSNIWMVGGRLNPGFVFDSIRAVTYADPGRKRIPAGIMNYLGGNELALLRLVDPIRNSDKNTIDFLNTIEKDLIPHHRFWKEGIAYSGDRAVYVIGFRAKKDERNSPVSFTGSYTTLYNTEERVDGRAEGKLYIDGGTYTILKISYVVNATDRIHGDFKIWELNEEYKMIDGKCYLSYLSYNNAVEIPDFSDSSYFYLENIVVDKPKGRIGLEFNNRPDFTSVSDAGFCQMTYNEKRVSFKSMQFSDTIIYLYPELFGLEFSSFSVDDLEKLDVRLRRIKDINGNVIGRYDYSFGYQYRELFVSNVWEKYETLPVSDLLDKMETMLNSKQPADNGDISQSFNTPLLGVHQNGSR